MLDAITLARFFSLNFLLVALYKAGHFSEWGCALWDAARVMDQGLHSAGALSVPALSLCLSL